MDKVKIQSEYSEDTGRIQGGYSGGTVEEVVVVVVVVSVVSVSVLLMMVGMLIKFVVVLHQTTGSTSRTRERV